MGIALGGVALQVPASFVAAAREVLDAVAGGSLAADLEALTPGTATRCPRCAGADLERSVPWSRRLLVVLCTVIAAAPFPARAENMHCRACGQRWRERRCPARFDRETPGPVRRGA